MASFNIKVCRLALVALAASASLANASPVAAQEAGASYRLRAQVPVACWVSTNQPLLADEGQAGEVFEACNNPGGFVVSASYRPLAETEKVKFFYGDSVLDLSKQGEQTLRRSNMATIRKVQYRFEEVELNLPLTLDLVIQPI